LAASAANTLIQVNDDEPGLAGASSHAWFPLQIVRACEKAKRLFF